VSAAALLEPVAACASLKNGSTHKVIVAVGPATAWGASRRDRCPRHCHEGEGEDSAADTASCHHFKLDLGLPIGAIAMPRSDVRLRMPFRRASANMTSVSGLQGRATISATRSLGHKGNVDIAVGRGSTGGMPDSATTANRRTAAGANQKPPKPQTRGGEGNPFNANAARVSDGRSVGVG